MRRDPLARRCICIVASLFDDLEILVFCQIEALFAEVNAFGICTSDANHCGRIWGFIGFCGRRDVLLCERETYVGGARNECADVESCVTIRGCARLPSALCPSRCHGAVDSQSGAERRCTQSAPVLVAIIVAVSLHWRKFVRRAIGFAANDALAKRYAWRSTKG